MGAQKRETKTAGLFRRALLGAALSAFALGPALLGAEGLRIEEGPKGVYLINETFRVPADRELVWKVLTDYGRMPDFISSVRASRVRERGGDSLLLEQDFRGKFLFFRRDVHVLLKVRETPLQAIVFEDMEGKDFDLYSGSWAIRDAGNEVEVSYTLKAKPDFAAPRFVARELFDKIAQALIEEVRSEIMERGRTAASGFGLQ